MKTTVRKRIRETVTICDIENCKNKAFQKCIGCEKDVCASHSTSYHTFSYYIIIVICESCITDTIKKILEKLLPMTTSPTTADLVNITSHSAKSFKLLSDAEAVPFNSEKGRATVD